MLNTIRKAPHSQIANATSQAEPDAEIVALFYQWIKAEKKANRSRLSNEAREELCDQAAAVAVKLAYIPAASSVGLSVKAFVAQCFTDGISYKKSLGPHLVKHDPDDDMVGNALTGSLLADAERFFSGLAPMLKTPQEVAAADVITLEAE